MGWVLTTLGLAVFIAVVIGATLALCKRYCVGCQWSVRDVWSICKEWRQRLSWLWAPREEKVGLVKAQHPTAQTMPGLYLQTGNASQHLLHSDSDLRLDAQGAFTRFEAVDRDLHPPLGMGTIPPQPLRPAPEPKATVRPRPSPLQTACTVDYLRMQESGPGPLTPPPSLQRVPTSSYTRAIAAPSVFVFQNEAMKNSDLFRAPLVKDHFPFRFDGDTASQLASESIQLSSYGAQKRGDPRLTTKYELDLPDKRPKDNGYEIRGNSYGQYETGTESSRSDKYVGHLNVVNDNNVNQYVDYDVVTERSSGTLRQLGRNEPQNNYTIGNSTNATTHAIMESIYGPQALTQTLRNDNDDHAGQKSANNLQNIEMMPFRNLDIQEDMLNSSSYLFRGTTMTDGYQRVSQYIQSLPDRSVYDAANDQNHQLHNRHHQDRQQFYYDDTIQASLKNLNEGIVFNPAPPPPAPSDPSADLIKKNEPTTGERIFSALRSVTAQSCIDASEFYNSVLSSAQIQHFTFISSPPSLANDTTANHVPNEVQDIYTESDQDAIALDGLRRSSDLYSPELNLEAHRTAQEVYNSLQDPPSSPLLLKDHSHESYNFMSDPSFTRTSEDIFNSLEQRRKSMERLNGIYEFNEFDSPETSRRRNSQELYAALEEVQLKRRLSQNLEDTYATSYGMNDHADSNMGSYRGSQGLDGDPPPDEATLKRAISCESICSDTSVTLNDPEEAPIVGQVCIGLEHERWGGRTTEGEGDLAVSVLEARDLVAPDGRPAQDTFSRVCLLPDRQTHVQTRLYRACPSPSYQEKFIFPLDRGPAGRTLLVEVFSDESTIGGGASLIGEASLKLEPAMRLPATTWLPLTGPALPSPNLGELMFSLSYLPTAERLTLVVVKARNLRGANAEPSDFFIKVYLLQQGKKIHKKKTSVKKGEKSPIFNEAIIFNVQAHALKITQLRLTVMESNSEQSINSKMYSVGHVIVGSTSVGRAQAHWRQMLTALRRPVAMWHPLRK